MVASIRTASTATNYLIQLGIYVENDIVTVKDRYEKLINKYSDMYKNKKKLLQGSNILYKELELIRNNTEKKRIEKDVIYRFIEDQEKMIKIKENLNKQLLNSEIIKFVQAVISRKKSDIIEKQLAEQREIAQDLVKMYEKQQQKAGIFMQIELLNCSVNIFLFVLQNVLYYKMQRKERSYQNYRLE